MKEEIIKLTVPEEYHLQRVDKFITNAQEYDLSRSYIQKLIKDDHILVNGLSIKQNYKSKTDDEIVITIPEPKKLEIDAENIPLDIIYEDSTIAVINKQPGLVVHPGPGNWEKTMVNALLYHLKDLSSIGGVIRPGIVHRLDKDTSGIIVVAKNDEAHKSLADQFANRTVKKKYKTIVVGKLKDDSAIIDLPIGRHRKYRHKMTVTESGKEARTEYKVEKTFSSRLGTFSLVDVNLLTGRTHQIRVHFSSMGHPIVGDPIYSKKWEKYKVPFLLLASQEIKFKHPDTQEEVSFKVDLPEHMKLYLEKLENLDGKLH